jgi:serpin B
MKAILIGLLVAAALLAAGCGDEEEAGPSQTPRVASPTVERISPTASVTSSPAPPSTSPTAAPISPTTSPTTEPVQPTTSSTAEPAPEEQGLLVMSEMPRAAAALEAESDLPELAAGNSAFAFDLYQALRTGEGNLFFSPYSISQALAMTYAGAAGATKQQMAATLSFTLPDDQFHPAFNSLDLELASRAEGERGTEGREFQLNIANAIWGQAGYGFLPDFLDVLAQNYGAGLRVLDFISAPEESRVTINDWVSEETEGKIEDLIAPGLIDGLTRLVLTNAIYFNAPWSFPFDPQSTEARTFHLLDGGEVTVPMMKQGTKMMYAEGEGYQALELPYGSGALSMLVLLPEAGQFEALETSLTADRVDAMIGGLDEWGVSVEMPKFEFESSIDLGETLAAMGMPDAFGNADFSGMTGNRELFIGFVVHKAFVSVDEKGTEAAAATGVGMEASAPNRNAKFTVDRPFIFLIRDRETGAILFLGRVLNPAA